MDVERKRETFRRGLECFNRRRFFECHEVLEETWLEEPEGEKPFYQGIIQVAAAFHQLFEKNNSRGAASLMRRGVKKLERYPAGYHGVDLAGLNRQLEPWLARLSRRQPTDRLPLPVIEAQI